ncbi:MAG: hypothetical protein RI841_13445 [Halomonas sp.]|uniref:hypothetical protein n=1 Tax=Halomonas sp. TaxID=1486246 RepID=UPI00287070B4|nr:hypothetical protein [Halomonas sp.]MDR9440479.1 hypothetical protein [Halomonas sp.]
MRFLKLLIPGLLLLAATPALAGHANPWATDDDDLLMQYHDENLQQSEDTPGEDEMLGIMEQHASGKLDAEETSGTTGGGQGHANGSGVDSGGSGGSGGEGGNGGGPGGGKGGNGGQR